MSADEARRAELAANLERVRARIAAACAAAGRDRPRSPWSRSPRPTRPPTWCSWPSSGVTDVGENRDQEAAPKAAEVAAAGVAVRWHFVGQLQRNKCRSVVGYADVVQSVDSVRLADGAGDRGRSRTRAGPLDVLVQVSLDGDPPRGGALPGDADLGRGSTGRGGGGRRDGAAAGAA